MLYAGLHRPERVAGLVLSTPALYTRTDIRFRDRARVLWSVLTGRALEVAGADVPGGPTLLL